MPKNQISDLITDQEMNFARLVLSGTMNDRDAAQAAGLNPETAAYTKSKPRVRAYMLEHRAAMQQQLIDQEGEEIRRKNQLRQKVLDRLWEIAALPAEVTRGSITGQVKAISMIMAIEGLIPDRRAGSGQKNSVPLPSQADIYPAAWLHQQQGNSDSQSAPALLDEEDEARLADAEPAPGSTADAPPSSGPIFDRRESTFANGVTSAETTPSTLSAPDTRVPFSIKKNPFARHR